MDTSSTEILPALPPPPSYFRRPNLTPPKPPAEDSLPTVFGLPLEPPPAGALAPEEPRLLDLENKSAKELADSFVRLVEAAVANFLRALEAARQSPGVQDLYVARLQEVFFHLQDVIARLREHQAKEALRNRLASQVQMVAEAIKALRQEVQEHQQSIGQVAEEVKTLHGGHTSDEMEE